MKTLSDILALIIAALHGWFLVLEMFLWRRPIGLRTFRNSPEAAAQTATLAANQGLYNGFLAAGLVVSVFFPEPLTALAFRFFFLTCVIIAGAYGAWSVSRRIFFIQAVPAILALLVTIIGA